MPKIAGRLPRRSIRAIARPQASWWPTLLFAGILCFVTFYAKGGLNLESMTSTEMSLTLAAGITIASAVLLAPLAGRAYGAWPVGLLLSFAVLSAVSVAWSVQPDESWRDADRLLAYGAVFAAGVILAHVAADRWRAVLGGIALAAVVVCGFALLTKVFPGELAPYNAYARLEEPYGYWNAIGLTAALGAICCMWLGARRTGHPLMSALAYPAMGVLLLTLLLAFSRGALAALAVGLALWFGVVPLRLRGAAVLVAGALAAGALAAWAFSTDALSAEGVSAAGRASAGHQLGALLVAMVAVLTVVGLAAGFLTSRRAPSARARRNAGALLWSLIALALLSFAGALAHSQRGFTGSISHAVTSLTDPNAKPPPNTPSRLTAVASVRSRYWKEALQIFAAHPTVGAGAAAYQTARMRYRKETLQVRHAHGFIVQTLADLGLAGLAVVLALLASWMAAAGRATHPFNRRWRSWREMRAGARPSWRRVPERYSPERIGMLSMLCVVVVFGAHSLVDWTWYVPGNACVALLCAGWLAGRGPLSSKRRAAAVQVDRTLALQRALARREGLVAAVRKLGATRLGAAAAVLVAALLAAWSQWQPQRSEDARQEALAVLAHDPRGAAAAASTAVSRDPLSAEALLTLSYVQRTSGRPTLARATLQRAVRLQPSNPQTWLALARSDLASDPRAALPEVQAAVFLNPESIAPEALAKEPEAVEIYNDYVEALRAAGPPHTIRTGSASHAPAKGSAPRASRR
jgi:O-antigen ligase